MPFFRSFQTTTRWAIGLLWIAAVADVIAVFSGIAEFALLTEIESGTHSQNILEAATQNDQRQRLIAFIQVAVWIVSAVTNLIWIRKANINARALGATGMRFTPNWSIGWYFIPIANLWKPYQALTEIWRASGGAPNWESEMAPWLFPIWWTVWLISAALGRSASRLSMNADGLLEMKNASRAMTLADVASIVAIFAFLAVIRNIANRQKGTAAVEGIPQTSENTIHA